MVATSDLLDDDIPDASKPVLEIVAVVSVETCCLISGLDTLEVFGPMVSIKLTAALSSLLTVIAMLEDVDVIR